LSGKSGYSGLYSAIHSFLSVKFVQDIYIPGLFRGNDAAMSHHGIHARFNLPPAKITSAPVLSGFDSSFGHVIK
jgi:hypothetical protein